MTAVSGGWMGDYAKMDVPCIVKIPLGHQPVFMRRSQRAGSREEGVDDDLREHASQREFLSSARSRRVE